MNRITLVTLLSLCLLSQTLAADINSANAALARGDFAAASAEFLRLANDGDMKAQAHLGYMYYVGEGVQQSYEEAVKWYRKAAVQGDKDAQYNLAVAYAFGEGTKQDYKEAATWYRRAAEQGHPIAQYSLGISYSYGEGVKQDSAEAVKWFRQAADQGYARAQVQLATKYHTGDGVALDYEQAVAWYRKAADKGDAAAQYNLGSMYRSGKGVPQDYNQSLRWYRLAADQGYAAATNELASLERAIAGAQRSRSRPNLQPAPAQVAQAEPQSAREPLVEVESADLLTLDTESGDSDEMAMGESDTALESSEDAYMETAAEEKKPGRIRGFFSKIFKKDRAEQEVEVVDAGTSMPESETLPGDQVVDSAEQDYAEVIEETPVEDMSMAMDETQQEMDTEAEVMAAEPAEKKSRFGFFRKIFGKKDKDQEVTVEDHSMDEMMAEESADSEVDSSVLAYVTEDESDDEPASIEELNNAVDDSPAEPVAEAEAESMMEDEKPAKKKGFFSRLFGKKDREQPEEMEGDMVAMVDEGSESVPVLEEEIEIDSSAEEQAAMDALEEDEPKKKGFFGRLFGKKDKGEDSAEQAPAEEAMEDEEDYSSADAYSAPAEDMAAARLHLDNNNYDSAYNAFYDMASDGDAEAQYQLGLLYYQGLGIRQDYNEASHWYREAGKQGHSDAQYSLGNMYLMGEGVSQNDAEAIKWYERAADQGHVAAAHNVDNLRRVTAATSPPVEEIESALESEELDSEVAEGDEMMEEEKPKKGFFKRLFGKDDEEEEDSAEESVAEVQGPLPEIQPAEEELVEEEKPKKKGFFGRLFGKDDEGEDAAEESVAMVESETSAPVSQAAAMPASPAEPEQTFAEAVQGLEEYEKGLAYSFGDGVPQDDKRAFESFLRAAELGHTPAQYKTGVAYAYGEGVEKNPEQAVYWYRQAAAKGYALAQRNLGVMYMNGDGVEQNKPLAFAWQSILADSGNVMDVHRRDATRQQLSEAEIEEAMTIKSTLLGQ